MSNDIETKDSHVPSWVITHLTNWLNLFEKTSIDSEPGIDTIRRFANRLVDDIPFDYSVSHRIARILFVNLDHIQRDEQESFSVDIPENLRIIDHPNSYSNINFLIEHFYQYKADIIVDIDTLATNTIIIFLRSEEDSNGVQITYAKRQHEKKWKITKILTIHEFRN